MAEAAWLLKIMIDKSKTGIAMLPKARTVTVGVIILIACSAWAQQQDYRITTLELLRKAAEIVQSTDIAITDELAILKDIAVVQAQVDDHDGSDKIFRLLIRKTDTAILEQSNLNGRLSPQEKSRHPISRQVAWFIEIGLAQTRAGNAGSAFQTFGRAIELARELPNDDGLEGQISTVAQIGRAQWESRDRVGSQTTLQSAFQMAERQDPKSPDAWKSSLSISMAMTQVQTKDYEAAAASIEQAILFAARIEEKWVQALHFRSIAIAQAMLGDADGALASLQRMSDARVSDKPEDYMTVSLYNLIDRTKVALAFAEAGKRKAAEEQLQIVNKEICSLSEKGPEAEQVVSPVLQRIAMVRASLGDFKGALRAEAASTDKDFRERSLHHIALAHIKDGDFEGARQIADSLGSSDILAQIAIAQAKKGDVKEALQTTNSICCNSNKPESVRARAEALRAIGAARIVAGESKGVMDWALGQPTPIEKAYALLGVAEGILKRNTASSS